MNPKSLNIVLTHTVKISSGGVKRMKGNLLQMFLYRSLNMNKMCRLCHPTYHDIEIDILILKSILGLEPKFRVYRTTLRYISGCHF